ncbi:MAG: hypothetical protein WD648_05775, partial [Planctomycetaceae bacterium]
DSTELAEVPQPLPEREGSSENAAMTQHHVSEILARFAPRYRARQIDRLDESRGFSGATIFRIESSAGVFALRAWPPESLQPSRIRGLHGLLAHALSLGVAQVSVPVANSDGDTLVLADGRVWQIEPWMPGTADFYLHPSEARLTAAMDCLASFHSAAATFRASEDAQQWFFTRAEAPSPAVSERLERIRRWNREGASRLENAVSSADRDEFSDLAREYLRLSRLAAAYVADRLSAASRLRLPLQPCLRDVWHDHLLFTGDTVTGLIDASASRSDHIAIDLARLLGSLVADDAAQWQFALEAYSTHHPLTVDELSLVRVFDESGVLLSPLTWLERRYLRGDCFAKPQRVLERIERFLARLRTLVETL